MRASECPPHKDTKRRAPRVLHRAEPETEPRPGGWGASGAAALHCLKTGSGRLGSCGCGGKTNADAKAAPADHAFPHFAAVKKPQQNHTLAQSGQRQSPPIRQPKRVGGRVWGDESKAVGASVGCRRLCSFRMPGVPARLEIVPGVCWL